jgi:hypothetical protein
LIKKKDLEEVRDLLPPNKSDLPLESVFLSDFTMSVLIEKTFLNFSTKMAFLTDVTFKHQKKYLSILTIQKIDEKFFYLIDECKESRPKNVYPIKGGM